MVGLEPTEACTSHPRRCRVAIHPDDNYGCRQWRSLDALGSTGFTDDEMRHPIANPITTTSALDRPDVEMVIGPDAAGRLLEIGIIETDDGSYVIRAV
jgi:hypothetical protein